MKDMYSKLIGPLSFHNNSLRKNNNDLTNFGDILTRLFEAIEYSFSKSGQEEEQSKARLMISEISSQILRLPKHQNNLSSLTITYQNNNSSLSDFLFSYLKSIEILPEKLGVINQWIYRNFIEPEIYKQLTKLLYQYSNSNKFVDLLSAFPIYFNPDYKEKLRSLLYQLKNKTMTISSLMELRYLLNSSWDYVIIQPNLLSCFLRREYPSLLNYLLTLCEPLWRRNIGNFPEALLPELLDLINVYYDNIGKENKGNVNNQLVVFFTKLYESPLESLHAFYIEKITYNGKSIFLLEFLADIWVNTQDLDKINCLLDLLFEKNHSLIIRNDRLKPSYQQILTKEEGYLFFLIAQLKKSLSPNEIQYSAIDTIENKIRTHHVSNSKEIVEELRLVYAMRWQKIKDTDNDYLRLSTPNPWIQLAQYLAGIRLIESNYYKFLIPSLKDDIIPFIEEEIIKFPLNHFILSKAEDELIFLPNSLKFYEEKGRFLHCNSSQCVKLNSIEEARIHYADPVLKEFFLNTKKPIKEGFLKRETVKLVQQLVQETIINPKGFDETQDYPQTSYALATHAYAKFIKTLENLPESEREILYQQRISYKGETHNFIHILKDIVERNKCLTIRGMFFAQLVIDYDPEFEFKFVDKINQVVNLSSMRMQSAKKIYAEENTLSTKDIIRRVSILAESILTLKFTGMNLILIEHNGLTNRVPGTAHKLFLIVQSLFATQFENAKYVYHREINTIIHLALNEQSWSSLFTRATATQQWLASLEDQSLFKGGIFYSPSIILRVLWKNADYHTRDKTFDLVESIIKVLIRENNSYFQSVKINILLKEWLSTSTIKPNVINALNNPGSAASPRETLLIVGDYLINIIQMECSNLSKIQFGFFKTPEVVLQRLIDKKRICQNVKELFKEAKQIAQELDLGQIFDIFTESEPKFEYGIR